MTEGFKAMHLNMDVDQPMAGFLEPVHDSQRIFRSVLEAMAHPGSIVTLDDLGEAPTPLNKSTVAICLSLVDHETPIWSDFDIASSGQAMNHLRFHCGCPVTTSLKDAHTILISKPSKLKSFDQFCIGTDERPDVSATVVVQVESLSENEGMILSGPGIKNKSHLNVGGVGLPFWKAVQENALLFPRGIDLILTTDNDIVCLPRTTQLEL